MYSDLQGIFIDFLIDHMLYATWQTKEADIFL